MPGEIQQITSFAERLEEAGIAYRVDIIRDNSVLFHIAVPGERWEVEFLTDGSVEVETFHTTGDIAGEEKLAELFRLFSD